MMGIMFADNRKNKGLFFQEPKGKKTSCYLIKRNKI